MLMYTYISMYMYVYMYQDVERCHGIRIMTCGSSRLAEKTPLWLAHGSVRSTMWMKLAGP